MKAVVINRYGKNDVVEIKDVPMPIPVQDEVLIKVHVASVNPVDWKIRSGMLRMVTGGIFPKILGRECAGDVAETGGRVKHFKKGDQVIGLPSIRRMGAFAEYAIAPEKTVFPKLMNVSYEDAAAIPIAGLTALQSLRDYGKIAPGRKVLVNGASGGVGHFAVQIARIFGAHVTAVCSGAKIDFVKSLGADLVIDYTRQDFTAGGEQFDIIFDAVAKRTFGQCKKALAPNGVYISTLPFPSTVINQYVTGFFTGKKAKAVWVVPNADDVKWMQDQIKAGTIRVAIEKAYLIDQAKEALAYSESGRATGKIILKVI